jgi:hypothetical protein
MKKLFFYSLIITLSSCNFLTETNQQKAEKAIKQYLKENLHDPKSYEPESFSELDSSFSSFEDSEVGSKLKQVDEDLSNRLNDLNGKIDNAKNLAELTEVEEEGKKIIEKRDSLFELKLKKTEEYKGEFMGYRISHTYRAKNAMGALVKESNYFKLDKDFKIIEF